MKKIFIMSIKTCYQSLFSCQAQNKGYKVIGLDSGFNGWQAAGKEIVKE